MKNVLLIFGGMSYEHDISIVSASQIFNKTRLKNYQIIPVYWSKNNRFFIYKNNQFCLSDFVKFDDDKPPKNLKEVVFVSSEKGKLFSKSLFGLKEIISSNLAIIACHGGDGENGGLVSFLEQHGIFSSAGSIEGLMISMNKILFKNLMKSIKIPVVKGFVLNKETYSNYNYEKELKNLKFPVVLKPIKGGSSIGLFVAKSIDEFQEKIKDAFEFDDEILVENFISGAREFNIAVLGDKDTFEISEIDEPLKISEILTFEDKYMSGEKSEKGGMKSLNSMAGQKRKFPAVVDEDVSEKIKYYAKEIFKNMNLSGVARIDFLYDETKNKLYVCEVNAIPGSLAFYFFSSGEILINSFVLKLIDIANKKYEKQSNIKIDFITNILS